VEITYDIMSRSSFTPTHPDAKLPDFAISHFLEETPNTIKRTIEECFIGQSIKDCNPKSKIVADALMINALIGIQREVQETFGEQDWAGMLKSYDMPIEYRESFGILHDMNEKNNDRMTEGEFYEAMGSDELN
jgi:hypothetical protein